MAINFFNSLAVGTNVLYVDTLNDRVGIGTSTPDTGTNLHVLSGTSSGQIKLTSQANTQFQFYGDGNQDINYGQPPNFPLPGGDAIGQIRYSHGSNYMAFKVNNAEMVRFASNNKVGIGTTSPSNGKLQIDSTGNQISIETGTSGDGRLHVGHFSNGTFIGTYGDDGGAADLIRFGTHSGDERMRITSSGNVGIGTTTPSQKLHVAGNVTADRYYGNGSTVYYVDPNDSTTAAVLAGGLEIGYGSAGEYRIEVGEGRTGNGYAYIDFVGDTTYSDYGLRLIRNNSGANTSSQLVHRGTGNLEFKTWDAGAMLFSTTNSERMRITSGGNVGIGTSSPSRPLTVYSDVGSTNILGVFDNSGTTAANCVIAFSDPNSTAGQFSTRLGSVGDALAFYTNGANERMRIDSSGNVQIGSGTRFGKFDILDVGGSGTNFIVGAGSNGDNYFTSGTSGIQVFRSGSTERLRIGSAGQIGIGGANYGTSGQVLTSNGSGSAPSWQNASGSSNWTLSGNNIYNNNSGNVGIGTASPTTKLYVAGNIQVNNPSGAANGSPNETARIVNTTSGATSSYMYIGASSGNDWRVGKNILGTSGGSNFGIALHAGSTLALEIDGSSNVISNVSSRAPIFYDSDNTAYYANPAGTSNLNAATFAGQIATTQSQITTNIGTTSAIRLKPTSTTNTTGKSSIFLGTSSVDNYGISLRGARLGTDGTPTFELATHFNSANGTVALSIDNSQNATFAGDVGIGTTSPGYELEVNGTAKADEFVSLVNASNSGITRDWTIIGTGDRGAGLQVNDISGAKYAIYAGGYDLTFGKHVSSNNTYTTAMGIYAANATDSSPYVQATHSLRAPIFYDSNSTTYYVDPASTSILRHVNFNNNGITAWYRSGGNAHQRADARLDSTDAARLHWYGKTDSGSNTGFRHAWYDGADYVHVTAQSDFVYFDRVSGTVSVQSDGSFRSPIFYDSNDTGYYADPNSSSIFRDLELRTYGLRLSRSYSHNGIWFNGGTDDNHVLWNDYYGGPNARGAANSGFDGIKWNTYRGIHLKGGIDGAYNIIVAQNLSSSSNNHTVELYAHNVKQFETESGYALATNQMRAPIFYDSNNTGYYVDPEGTSVMNDISNGSSNGSISYGYDVSSISNTIGVSNWFRSSGDTGWYSGTYGGGIYMSDTTWIRTYNSKKYYTGSTSYDAFYTTGGVRALTQMRAPIYYDENNTGYYVDPASTSNVSALTVNATNGITMGSVSGAPPSTRLKIAGIGNGGCALFIQGSGFTSNVQVTLPTYASGIALDNTGAFGTNALIFNRNGTNAGEIIINSGGTTSYSTTSDYRLKENVVKLTNGIERVKQLKPKRFNFILDENKEIIDGFIAHEAKEVVPESVNGEKDEVLPNGDPVYQGIDQAKLVPLLTAALQEAIAKIEDLETRIQILENQ